MLNLAGAAHAIEWATDRFWSRVAVLIRHGGRSSKPGKPEPLAAGVVAIDGEAHIAPDAAVDEQSFVFRFAATAAHAGLPMAGRSLRMMASRGTPPGEDWTEATRRAFVSLLGGVAAFGFLGLILGPILVALADAAVEVYAAQQAKQRLAAASG